MDSDQCSDTEPEFFEGITEQLKNLQALLENNQELQFTSNLTAGDVYGIIDECLTVIVNSQEFQGSILNSKNNIDVHLILKDHLSVLENILERYEKEAIVDQTRADNFHSKISDFRQILQKKMCKTNKEPNIEIIEKNLRRRFIEEKKQLKIVISHLLPENTDLRNLLSEILMHSVSSEPHEYYEVEYSDNIAEQINFLLRTKIFECHPTNPLKVRMVNL